MVKFCFALKGSGSEVHHTLRPLPSGTAERRYVSSALHSRSLLQHSPSDSKVKTSQKAGIFQRNFLSRPSSPG